MKISDTDLIIEASDYIKHKKITATKLNALIGGSKFSKPGDKVLEMMGLYSEEIDPFYGKRGAIAEKIVNYYLKKKGKTTKTWDPQSINYDNFPKNPYFGGMIDIAVVAPERCVVECKSKNIKDFAKTQKFPNEDYEMQETYYQYLSKCDKGLLIYVFFTDEQEERIRNDQPIDIENEKFKFYGYSPVYNEEKIKAAMDQAMLYSNKCFATWRIPLKDISDKVLNKLKETHNITKYSR